MPVDRLEDKVVLRHHKGATVEILYYGATVISWKVQGVERLFVSANASLDGSKPVRGGIPVVFPCFGAPTHHDHMKLSQHGFARSERWSFETIVLDDDAGVSVRFTLSPTAQIASKFEPNFKLAYVVTLADQQLNTDLYVYNPSGSSRDLEFQALFHNYIRAPASAVRIRPLQNVGYYDKTQQTDEDKALRRIESRAEVDVNKFTDFVYENPLGNYQVTWPGGEIDIRTKNLENVVIWNPQEGGKKIADMEESGWERFVCVEPGYVRGFVNINPGEKWIGQQTLTIKT